MIRASRRMPDFAGVALVDILANGVAMLIIVIVVSIAARTEREERYAEQTNEIATVMSHKFSTSLVLNSLAASPPARLHDYETSAIDQILDPELLPILELHAGFVREFYTGTLWTRRELLEERSALSAWLAAMSDERKARLRVDVYDIPQFYLTMSILREHGINVYHWHFLTGALAFDEAARCPAGVAAKDCPGGDADAPAPLPQLSLEGPGSGARGGGQALAAGPGQGPGGTGSAPGFVSGSQGPEPGAMPGGVVPGFAGTGGAGFVADGAGAEAAGGAFGAGRGRPGGAATERGLLSRSPAAGQGGRGFGAEPGPDPAAAATLGSFPNAREGGSDPSAGRGGGRSARGGEGRNGARQRSAAGAGSGGTGPQMSLRIALPESIRRAARSTDEGAPAPALEALFGIVLHYLGEMQDSLDGGGTPSRQIEGFAERIQTAFREPPANTEAERRVARDLALKFALIPHLGEPGARPGPLTLRRTAPAADGDSVLVVEPNALNDAVGVERRDAAGVAAKHVVPDQRTGPGHGAGEPDGPRQDAALPERARAALALNAYPGIWQGLEIRIEPYSVLLMPPAVREAERMRWRAVAYLAPALDDLVVGFVFARVDAEGRLRIQGDANRVRLEGRPLFTEYRESAFGSRGWLVTLYAALAAGLLLLGVSWRFVAGHTA